MGGERVLSNKYRLERTRQGVHLGTHVHTRDVHAALYTRAENTRMYTPESARTYLMFRVHIRNFVFVNIRGSKDAYLWSFIQIMNTENIFALLYLQQKEKCHLSTYLKVSEFSK